MTRAFIAVELGDALRQQIAQVQQHLQEQLGGVAGGAARIAWVRPSSIHLTLKFIGDIDERRIGALRETIAATVRSHHSVTIPLARFGAFPRPQEPRTLWIGASETWENGDDARRLSALVDTIDSCCEAQGVPREHRPFAPHLTLARIKAGERQVGRALTGMGAIDRPLTLEPLPVAALALMQSQLNADGAVHTRLWQIRLDMIS
jgi:2'-5' RNA ligase